MLSVKNIAKCFGKKQVLSDVSFVLEPGNLYGVVGENGSGKTTLLKIIVGEWRADKGEVSISGRFGYCPQKCLLIPQLSIDEHFLYFASAFGLSESERIDQSEELMDYFNFSKYRASQVHTLSGGTQQKLNLAIALLNRPNLLILDEPYSGFDWDTYSRFLSLTNQLRKDGCAVLIVTHLLTEQQNFDRVYQLVNGQLT